MPPIAAFSRLLKNPFSTAKTYKKPNKTEVLFPKQDFLKVLLAAVRCR